jgi:uncharacterized membrane protein
MITAKIRLKWLPYDVPYSLLIIVISFNIFFIAYSLQKHAAFQTAGFDLGVWDQMTWNTLHGRPFWLTHHDDIVNGLGDHVEFILLLVFPLYGLYKGPETLLVFQTIIVSLGAFPIYWWAKERLGLATAGLVYVLVYLLYPALGAAVTFDVHSLTLAVPILTYALWAMFTKRYRLFVVMTILAMSCKEDISLLIFMMGLYVLIVQRNYKVASITMVGSITWFIVAIYVIIPAFRPGGGNEYLYRYIEWGNSTSEIMINVITNPGRVIQVISAGDKFFYWIRLTLPVFFTALLDPLTLILAAPTLLLNTLGNYPAAYQLDLFHHSAPLAPYITMASINGLAGLNNFVEPKLKYVRPGFLRKLLVIMILLVTISYQVQFGHTPIGRYFNWPIITEHHQNARKMLYLIPPQAIVAAQNGLAPRLSHRQWIFILPNLAYEQMQAEYIAMDMQGNLDLHQSIVRYCDQLHDLLSDPSYGLLTADDGLLLFKRGAANAVTFRPMAPCP